MSSFASCHQIVHLLYSSIMRKDHSCSWTLESGIRRPIALEANEHTSFFLIAKCLRRPLIRVGYKLPPVIYISRSPRLLSFLSTAVVRLLSPSGWRAGSFSCFAEDRCRVVREKRQKCDTKHLPHCFERRLLATFRETCIHSSGWVDISLMRRLLLLIL